MKMKEKPWNQRQQNEQENEMNEMLDRLTEFEEFQRTVLPAIQKDLKSGMDAKALREKYLALIQARQITDVLMAPIGDAIDGAQKIIDRAEGRATEKKEVKHRFEELPDQQLDAVLTSMLNQEETEPKAH